MRKTNLRGGTDYKINEILGKNFKDFIGLLRGNDLTKFTFDAYGDKSATTTGGANSPKPNDLHYDFSQYLMAAATAFREIEIPDVEKAAISGTYADDLKKMYDELVGMESGIPTGGISAPDRYSFEFTALPYYKDRGMNINYLSTVFHLLPYTDKIFENFDNSSYGGLVNAIRYIYHFISLLELDNVNVKDVMVLLRTDDAFMYYVDQIVGTLSSLTYFTKESKLPSGDEPSKATISSSVINGLTAVAEEIINELRNIPVNPVLLPTKFDDIRTLDFLNAKTFEADMKKFITDLGVTPVKVVNRIYNDLGPINAAANQFYPDLVGARAAVPDEEKERLTLSIH